MSTKGPSAGGEQYLSPAVTQAFTLGRVCLRAFQHLGESLAPTSVQSVEGTAQNRVHTDAAFAEIVQALSTPTSANSSRG